ncbi:hypothetical protein Lfu02_53880 [Longispora fulva]|uniref:AMIN-like domain-containing protein n=1 Tax=Longispora fulva TaxID=619741 RepID=A0A8J7GWP9_9ACTN|nr:hypothetical protein [Longispora fulva]MBG6140720.1 hypothetical protein [Longispora fulva]GIG61016.1 hypothetical protein Lfu02_53880 [Longispora fulva]
MSARSIATRSAAVLGTALFAFAALAPAAHAAPAAADSQLTNIEWGSHPGYDRVQLDFGGPVPAFGVTRVSELTNCGSGKPVDLPGTEFIEVNLGASAHDANGHDTFPGDWQKVLNLPYVTGYAITCDFEGDLRVGVGIRGHHAFTTSPQSNPSRIAVDIHA